MVAVGDSVIVCIINIPSRISDVGTQGRLVIMSPVTLHPS